MTLFMGLFCLSCSSTGHFFDNLKKHVKGVREDKNPFRIVWSKNLDPHYDSGNLPINYGSPFIYNNMVYAGAQSGLMKAYDLESGRIIWSVDEKRPLNTHPGIYKDHIYYGSTLGRLFVRHYLTGKLKYSIDLGAAIQTRPVFYQDRVFLHLRNHSLVCLDALTGKIIWSYQKSIASTITVQRNSAPLIHQNKLYVGFPDGTLGVFAVEDGTLLWEERLARQVKFNDVDASPTARGNFLYVGSLAGPLTVMDIKSKTVVQKFNELTIARSPLIHGKDLIVGTTNGLVARIDSQNTITKKKKLDEFSVSSIKRWKDQIVVSTAGGVIYFLNPKTLEVNDKFPLGSAHSAILGSLEVLDRYLVVYSSRNRLYVLQ